MHPPDPLDQARLAAHTAVGTHLSLLSDRRLAETVAAAAPLGGGIGGRSAELEVEGRRVFVKRVPLTDVELLPQHVRSTANVFELPVFYQYGAGSTGFGAWRELAAHVMTTNWALAGAYGGFPLMYHWRVLPDSAPEGFADVFGGVDGAVAHWAGSERVRERLEAIGRSSAGLVLFLEHLPQTLAAWLDERRGVGASVAGGDSPFTAVEDELVRGTQFMRSHGLVHFDAHFANVLTDGGRLYFADFGLALSSGFELSAREAAFLSDHLGYDGCYAAAHLLRHHVLPGVRGETDHEEFLRGWVAGQRPADVPAQVAGIVDRHARGAVVLEEFHRRLLTVSKRTPFPAARLRRALDPDPAVPQPGPAVAP